MQASFFVMPLNIILYISALTVSNCFWEKKIIFITNSLLFLWLSYLNSAQPTFFCFVCFTYTVYRYLWENIQGF